ncbi:hypothetical protein CEXT_666771 [Caerostris extrusa]|uniref:Uncharacterized protein n=1 Tax=Caerostris extrusa TaxID=172846 RepID=A0AAV4RFH5_CAEEX|nr:hypothetical protein CEXT_666771 [Caerostris extrusa]
MKAMSNAQFWIKIFFRFFQSFPFTISKTTAAECTEMQFCSIGLQNSPISQMASQLAAKKAKLQSIDSKQTTPGRQPKRISMNRTSTDLFDILFPAAHNTRKKMPHKQGKETESENQMQKSVSFALKAEFKNFDLYKQFGLPLLWVY